MQAWPEPSPGPGELRVDVRAAGVNFADLLATQGLYPDAPRPPAVLGYEVAGVVTELGPGVEGFAVGDRVAAPTWFGGWAETAVASADTVLPLPGHLSFEDGAAIPVAFGTAYAGLVQYGALKAGERVLVHAAAGGVGIAATQIATSQGAEVWGTASSAKHDVLRANGVAHPLDYTRRGWHRGVPGLDLVMDPLGGRSLRRSYRMLRAGGRLVCYGATHAVSGESRDLVAAARSILTVPWFHPIQRLMADSKTVIGLKLTVLWQELGTLAPYVAGVGRLLRDGAVRPIVHDAVPFDRAPQALRTIAERRNVGKVVLVP